MNNGEKTVVNPSVTENCTKQQFHSESAGPIFNVYGGVIFFLKSIFLAVPFAVMSRYFLCMRGGMETYWKVNEVATALQVSEQTIYRYVANGEIPFHKLNRAVRFKPSEIESWMESRKAGAITNENRSIGGEGNNGRGIGAVKGGRTAYGDKGVA